MLYKKKIGLFISHIFGDYQRNACQGVVDQALEYGFQTEIYTTNDGENLGCYGIGEESILRIPNLGDLAGVIIVSGTYLRTELRDQIFSFLEDKFHGPIIEINEGSTRFPAVSLENNLTAGSLAEHLITVHNAKRICYLGCLAETIFSDQRESAYRNVMRKYALPISDHDIFSCDYSESSMKDALSFFTKDGSELPDAILCYNDRIALLFTLTALSAGYRIPEDFALTGCDCTKEGQNITPPLTTVTFPVYQVGTTAVDQLISLMHGKSVPERTSVFAETYIAGSCGCSYLERRAPLFYEQELLSRINELESSTFTSMRMASDFSHITDIDDGMDLLAQYVSFLDGISEFYLCLYSDWNSPSDKIKLLMTEEEYKDDDETNDVSQNTMLLKLAIKDGRRLPECTFSKTSLLPEYICQNSSSAYIVSPLFFENRAFGYVVLAYADNKINYHFKMINWIMNITQLLLTISDSRGTQFLIDKLDSLYMRDLLTGLYNRNGFKHYFPELLKRQGNTDTLTAFFFDMDSLKQINDQFGHEEGNFALTVLGQAIKKNAGAGTICSRFGDDEFYVLSNAFTEETAPDYIRQVKRYLTNYNSLSSKPYQLTVSCGYATAPLSLCLDDSMLDQLMEQAEQNMYLAKH